MQESVSESAIFSGAQGKILDRPNEKNGKYIYAFILQEQQCDIEVSGIGNGNVYAITEGRVAAVVSDMDDKKLRPERRNLAAHQRVLKYFVERCALLPASFGIMADDSAAVHRLISENREIFEEQLSKVEGKVEMGLRVAWDVLDIFDYFVSHHLELREFRDKVFSAGHMSNYEEKIKIGQMFASFMEQDRKKYMEQVMDMLSPVCAEIKSNPPRSESEVMNLACLVKQKEQAQFEAAVFNAAGLFDNSFSFDYNGPWAPHNFVELRLGL